MIWRPTWSGARDDADGLRASALSPYTCPAATLAARPVDADASGASAERKASDALVRSPRAFAVPATPVQFSPSPSAVPATATSPSAKTNGPAPV